MRTIVVVAVLLSLAACGKQESKQTAPAPAGQEPASRPFSAENLFNGARLFQQHCAQCHGPEAQGHPDWQNPKVAAAPPLNGSGNIWKRRKQDMIAIIRDGAKRHGEPVMPSWKGRLTEREIEDIISWYQALWPAEVYERWRKADATQSAPRG